MFSLLFPPKCVLCRRLLRANETELCHSCRTDSPEFFHSKRNIPFIAHWTAIWYYKENVRSSIHRFKFYNARGYANTYGKLLAMKLQQESFDILTWVPVHFLRRLRRGYDQSELIAAVTAKELGVTSMGVLKKVRHTAPQSTRRDAAHRRGNILNAYRVRDPEVIQGKRILLLDDVITTGATASECAKTLLTSGAKEVIFAAVAAASHDKK